jgi:hypothetical protein
MCHTYFVISENTFHEMLSNPHEFVSEFDALGSKSAEYVFGFKKLV